MLTSNRHGLADTWEVKRCPAKKPSQGRKNTPQCGKQAAHTVRSSSVRERHKSRLSALCRRRPCHIHDHGKKGIVAIDAHQVDDALFAEFPQGLRINFIANALVVVKLCTKVV